jgi:hypothetical protein
MGIQATPRRERSGSLTSPLMGHHVTPKIAPNLNCNPIRDGTGSNPATAKNKAGLSFIPIQKNPKFSIKRTVTVF